MTKKRGLKKLTSVFFPKKLLYQTGKENEMRSIRKDIKEICQGDGEETLHEDRDAACRESI